MKRSALIMTVAMSLATPLWVAAEEPRTAETEVGQELARLNLVIQEIASLLRKQVEGQETDLLIQRLELSQRTLDASRQRLRNARALLAEVELEEASLARRLEAHQEAVSKQESEGLSEPNPFELLLADEMELEIEAKRSQQRELAREIIELENEVAVREEDQDLIEEVVDARLGLR